MGFGVLEAKKMEDIWARKWARIIFCILNFDNFVDLFQLGYFGSPWKSYKFIVGEEEEEGWTVQNPNCAGWNETLEFLEEK